MSDLMLLGVLRMPMPDDPDPLTLRQFIDRSRQAADRIEQLERVLAQAREALKDGDLDMVYAAIAAIDDALHTEVSEKR